MGDGGVKNKRYKYGHAVCNCTNNLIDVQEIYYYNLHGLYYHVFTFTFTIVFTLANLHRLIRLNPLDHPVR